MLAVNLTDQNTKFLDGLTRKHTAASSFAELTRLEGDYFPSLYHTDDDPELKALADAYDEFMIAAGSPKRVFRGGSALASQVEIENLLAETDEVRTRRELANLCLLFINQADGVELGILRDTLAHWSTAYPVADHDEELVIGTSMRIALEYFYRPERLAA
jgi:hypothetical protein